MGVPVRIDISLLLALPVLGWWIQRGVSVRVWIDVLTAISPHALAYSSIGTGATPWLIGTTVFFGFSASLFVHELARVGVARRHDIEAGTSSCGFSAASRSSITNPGISNTRRRSRCPD
ncbi:hypothetical protein ACFFQF_09560 [Haladaptatus pallidirubidus]|uniref:hypothetical protein n=1 Tax=Haladaptatus pallidirubidus TaxID=1008152 RepID=UPI0035EE6737